MRYHFFLSLLALCLSAVMVSAVEPAELKPALVATFTAGKESVTRLEPTVALALAAGESTHPRLSAISNATWKGYINITRPGKYSFSANVLNGRLRVEIGGKLVLDGSGENGKLSNVQSNEVQLDGGVQPFVATFVPAGNQATRAELLWRGPGFVIEPLPHQFLGHLAKERPVEFAKDLELEHGRFRFEELGCIQCHKPENGDAMARTLVSKPGQTSRESPIARTPAGSMRGLPTRPHIARRPPCPKCSRTTNADKQSDSRSRSISFHSRKAQSAHTNPR